MYIFVELQSLEILKKEQKTVSPTAKWLNRSLVVVFPARIPEILGSNLEIRYLNWECARFHSASPVKCLNITLNYATADFFHIISN